MIMALVEDGMRQELRQRFSKLPEPVFNECLRTNCSNLELCIRQLQQRSQDQERESMCAVAAGMDPGQSREPGSPQNSLLTRTNSDEWEKVDWPPLMYQYSTSGDTPNNPRTTTTTTTNPRSQPTSPWNDVAEEHLYRFRPPMQVSQMTVNLGGTGNKKPNQRPPKEPSPHRPVARSGSRTPQSPESSGLQTSIILPGISPPPERTPSPLVNPFFPPISESNGLGQRPIVHEGSSSPDVYPYGNRDSPQRGHAHRIPNTSSSTAAPFMPSAHNSQTTQHLTPVVVQQPNVVTSHPVSPHHLNSPLPSPDVRRKTPSPYTPNDPHRWHEGHSPRPSPNPSPSPRHNTDAGQRPVQRPKPEGYGAKPLHVRPPPPEVEGQEYRKRMGSQEELAYNQALIMHQNARKERLRRDLMEELDKLDKAREEVQNMERDLEKERAHKSPFPSPEELSKLREEKRQLQIDIECMNKEIDLLKKQGYLWVDPQAVYFYDNMGSTGPVGPVTNKGPPAPVQTPPVLDPEEGQHWSCTHCTFLNHPFLDKCECCEMPRDTA